MLHPNTSISLCCTFKSRICRAQPSFVLYKTVSPSNLKWFQLYLLTYFRINYILQIWFLVMRRKENIGSSNVRLVARIFICVYRFQDKTRHVIRMQSVYIMSLGSFIFLTTRDSALYVLYSVREQNKLDHKMFIHIQLPTYFCKLKFLANMNEKYI